MADSEFFFEFGTTLKLTHACFAQKIYLLLLTSFVSHHILKVLLRRPNWLFLFWRKTCVRRTSSWFFSQPEIRLKWKIFKRLLLRFLVSDYIASSSLDTYCMVFEKTFVQSAMIRWLWKDRVICWSKKELLWKTRFKNHAFIYRFWHTISLARRRLKWRTTRWNGKLRFCHDHCLQSWL